jgi:hypothetical protein
MQDTRETIPFITSYPYIRPTFLHNEDFLAVVRLRFLHDQLLPRHPANAWLTRSSRKLIQVREW